MQGALARAANAYQQTHVQSRSPLELVVMLYDGALRFVGEAQAALGRKDLAGKRDAISRALAIVSELQNTLDMERGGDIARSLDGLYAYANSKLLEANMQNDGDRLEEVARIFSTLREAWGEIATRSDLQTGTGR
ncbi:MAG: flagellar export chaperone FliS [Vicinamibacterales bacterium]